MEKTKKTTKREVLEAIRTLMEQDVTGMISDTVSADDVINYCDVTLAQLDSKAVKAKERQAKAKAEDPLRELVYSYVGDELQTINEIVAKVNENDDYTEVTNSKVVARLSRLVKEQLIVKELIKVDGRQVMGYRLNKEEEN